MKGPPDACECVKTRLGTIIKNGFALDGLKDAVIRTNHIVITTYQFIKAFYLHQTERKLDIPKIDENFIDKCFKVVSERTGT